MSNERNFTVLMLTVLVLFLATGLVSAQIPDRSFLVPRVGNYDEPGLAQNKTNKQLSDSPTSVIDSFGGDWIVDTLVDEDSDGECAVDCTLRDAVDLASSGDTIIFDDAIAGGTITFSGESWEDLKIIIDKDLTIDNSNHVDKITIDGNDISRIFHVEYGIEFTLNNLIFENGTGSGAGIYNDGGVVTILDSLFNDNGSISTSGGAIYNTNQVFVFRTIFANNSGSNGGAIFNTHELEIHDSFFENNFATNRGGAIYNSLGSAENMLLIIDGCTFSGNSVTNYDGGAVYNDSHGSVNVANSTFYGNSANRGGAVFADTNVDDLLIVNSTFSDNSAAAGAGGIHTFGFMRLYNSILANSTGGAADCYQNIAGTNWIFHSLIETNSESPYACYDISNLTGDPALGALQDNGGNTYTMALGVSSPAIDSGASGTDPNGGSYCLPVDQRGVDRPQGSFCDLGAYEVVTAPIVLSITRGNNSPTSADNVLFIITFSNSVTGVDTTDFGLNATGVTGASIIGYGGSGNTRTITVDTGTGFGTMGLNLYDNDTIMAEGIPLGGAGVGNGDYTEGEVYIIDSTPRFTSHPVTDVNVGGTYSYEVETADADLPLGDTLTISARSLPAWLHLTDINTVNGTATLTGTPSTLDYGDFDISLKVKDSLNVSATQNFTIIVNRYPSFSSIPVTTATVGETYSYNITANDKDKDSLTITAPTKPSWLTLTDYGNGTALLTGVPVTPGSNSVTLRVSDGNAYVNQSFSIVVSEAVEYINFVPLLLN